MLTFVSNKSSGMNNINQETGSTIMGKTRKHHPHQPPNSMEQSPSWEANRSSTIQEVPRILWNPKIHYNLYNGQSPAPILSQIDPVQAPNPFL
jgi:hypothetical protein